MADHQHQPDHLAEPDHQPLAPATRGEHAAEPDHLQAAAAIAARAYRWPVQLRLQPGSCACLMAIRAGADNTADIAAITGLSISTVRTALSRLQGGGRWLRVQSATTGKKRLTLTEGNHYRLIDTRPHPHATANGQRQLTLTETGLQLADALLGSARALAGR